MGVLRNRTLLTLMLGHFTVDLYVGLLPVLYPLLIQRFTLDLRTVGLVSLAYSGMASISQPFFGWVADRYGTRLTGLTLIWTATIFSTIGFAPSFPVLLSLAAAAGLGSGMFHPFGALQARAAIAEERRNTAMSIYVTAGTVGVALGPLIGAVIFTLLGVRGTILMCLPGICSALWLLHALGQTPDRGRQRASVPTTPARPIRWVPLLAIISMMMSRNGTVVSLEAFIPSWYKSLGYTASFYSPLATTVVLASACGTIGSGTLADRFGRRAVILGTLLLSIPCILLFAQYTGGVAFLTGGMVGLLAASTGPLALGMAQELMVGRVGVASGLILGLGFVAGAIGVPITGALADAFGMATALRLQVLLVLFTMLLVPLLPSEARLSALRQE
jgi:FSR family fosmidomycin resistance protein-like MFS transporter